MEHEGRARVGEFGDVSLVPGKDRFLGGRQGVGAQGETPCQGRPRVGVAAEFLQQRGPVAEVTHPVHVVTEGAH
ncbi:hypothetical protein [Streptomyces europaeiscabiei]|uniref:hypothetical protein n=1 Tax=Streptomyces europaeiscabiei TaxID=146819 RepID=UPI00131B974C|nr:hypothetical protein [Streptomyces europaeiscabiei]MDX2526282.1 hypothetical protein [Streptomyces europaeiscabiei]MDX2767743.1 hypothetical protein [Streptomyces europaeiscabiei]MDX3847714.1 hypothetical protein [Streptomyces europaeiscabiei]